MERAGWGLALAMRRHVPGLGRRPLLFLCGTGNNGGDGFVAARWFQEDGLHPEVVVLGSPDRLRGDAPQALEKLLAAGGSVTFLTEAEQLRRLERTWGTRREPVVVDALLGTGSRGAPQGLVAEGVTLVERLRARGPTGLDAATGEVPGACVRADLTVTMAFPKTGFLFWPGRERVGRLVVVDIGIPDDRGPTRILLAPEAASLRPRRAWDAHKGDVGRVLVVGGSPGLTGAVALAGEAALATGAGLVTVGVPAGLNDIFETKLTEVMSLPLPDVDGHLQPEAADLLLGSRAREVLALGPGLGRYPGAEELVRQLYAKWPTPLVLDADGLFAFARLDWPDRSGPPAILTPHVGEMGRLLGMDPAEVRREAMTLARETARARGVVLVLKGAPTLVASPNGRLWINPTGNPGMATGGSGDVLTGVVAGLLAQGLEPLDAARLGVYLHGKAGDVAALRWGWEALTAGRMIEVLGEALEALGRPMGPIEETLVEHRITEAGSR
jgi:NAD(P)H-hydrate epimerase